MNVTKLSCLIAELLNHMMGECRAAVSIEPSVVCSVLYLVQACEFSWVGQRLSIEEFTMVYCKRV